MKPREPRCIIPLSKALSDRKVEPLIEWSMSDPQHTFTGDPAFGGTRYPYEAFRARLPEGSWPCCTGAGKRKAIDGGEMKQDRGITDDGHSRAGSSPNAQSKFAFRSASV